MNLSCDRIRSGEGWGHVSPSDLSAKKDADGSGSPFPVPRTSHVLLYLILRAQRQNLQGDLLCVPDEDAEVRRD